MAKKQSQKYTAAFKAQVALAAIQNQMTISEIVEKCKVSKGIIYKWKAEFLENASSVFDNHAEAKANQNQIDNLHRKIGELEMELDFAKRASAALGLEMPAKN